MRGVAVLVAVVLGAGALAAAHFSAHGGQPRRALALASSSCSSVSGCVQGCALPVASLRTSPGAPETPASPSTPAKPASPRPPTAPCAQHAATGCSEYVAGGPSTLLRNLDRAAQKRSTVPSGQGCGGPSTDFGERVAPPSGDFRSLRRHAERFLHEDRRAERAAKKR